eukprot:11674711-Alexandrium_andersonii.AAC.1
MCKGCRAPPKRRKRGRRSGRVIIADIAAAGRNREPDASVGDPPSITAIGGGCGAVGAEPP